MNRYHGYYWPDMADANVIRYINHAEDMRVAVRYAKGSKIAVQAGGHCGIWPLWLSNIFERVITFEPIKENFDCLELNCKKADNIIAFNAALGERPTRIAMRMNSKNTGGHKGMQEPGETPVVTIDGLQLTECDLIVLDVEGMELPALKGGVKTIEAFKPVIMLENRGHGDRFGWGGWEEIVEWLKKRGYSWRSKVSHDVVFVC